MLLFGGGEVDFSVYLPATVIYLLRSWDKEYFLMLAFLLQVLLNSDCV